MTGLWNWRRSTTWRSSPGSTTRPPGLRAVGNADGWTLAPPDNLEDYGDFVHAVVDRYRGRSATTRYGTSSTSTPNGAINRLTLKPT